MKRLLPLAMSLSIVGGLFTTSLGFDPIAHQVFREPKMLAMVWIAGFLLIAWGIGNLTSLFKGIEGNLPPLPTVALVPLILAIGWAWLGFYRSENFTVSSADGAPIQVLYQTHALLPVLAWFSIFACASFLFRSASSLRFLGLSVFMALGCQTAIVFAEVVENRTGLPVNPVGWLGTLDVGSGVVKQHLFGTIGNPNFVAGYLAIALVAATGWVLGLRKNLARILGALILSCALLGVILTRSKGALLALAFGFGHWVVVSWLSRPKTRAAGARSARGRWAAAGLVLVAIVGTVGFVYVESTSDPREGSYLDRWAETLVLRGDSITVRALLAHCGFDMWEDKPWLGWGAGGFKVNFLDRLKSLLEGPEGDRLAGRVNRLHSLRASHLHNEYLQILVEWGAIGFAFLQLFLVWCQTAAFQRIKHSNSPAQRSMRLGLLSAFWCGLGGSLFDMPFHRPAQAFLLAVVLGASLASRREGSEPRTPSSAFHRIGFLLVAAILFPLGVWLCERSLAKYTAQRNVYVARRILEGAARGPDLRKVEAALEKASDRVPGEGDYDYLLALYQLEAENNPAAAIARIRRARFTCDDPSLYLLEARAQIERNNFGSVGPILDFVEAIDPDRPGLRYLEGRLLQSRRKWRAACAAYRLEITNAEAFGWETAPQLAQCHFRLAGILERELGQYTQAANYYKRLIELQGDSKRGYPEAQIRLAEMCRDRFFDLDRAESYFRRALEIFEYQGRSDEAATIRDRIAEIDRRRAAESGSTP